MALSQKNKQTDKHPKRMITVDTELEREELEKRWKNAVLAKNATNDCLTYDRSGKHATNLKEFTLLSLCKIYKL